jgi:hypothetical protein
MNDGGLAFPYKTGYDDEYDNEDEDTRFERELQITIAESIKSEKRKRQLAADEELARKLQLQEEHEERIVRPVVAAVREDTCYPALVIGSWTCSMCSFKNHYTIDGANGETQQHCEICETKAPLSFETFEYLSPPVHSNIIPISSYYNGDFTSHHYTPFATDATSTITTDASASTVATNVMNTWTTSAASTTTATTMDNQINNDTKIDDEEEGQDYTELLQLQELQDYWNAKEESLLIASQIWTCVTCHKVNQKDVNLCSQCLEPKAASTSSAMISSSSSSSSSTVHSSPLPQDLWPCSKCTFDNSYDDKFCFMCGHAMPQRYQQLALLHHRAQHGTNRPSECGMPGCCQRAVYYGFCSKPHMDRALKKNIIPPSEPGVEAVLVGHTGDYTAHLLRASHPKHASVKKQFLDSWKKKDEGFPRVQRIYWIRMRPEILQSFDAMKLQLENCNVQRLFHGTSQSSTCYFGTNPLEVPCLNDANCRVCSIIRNSFDLVHVKRGEGGQAWAHQTQQLRYGVSSCNVLCCIVWYIVLYCVCKFCYFLLHGTVVYFVSPHNLPNKHTTHMIQSYLGGNVL